ncbi:hypothetical protein ACI703_09420 [Isoptericola jiangsuensis]|uniref:hypothetical protein n=1 Tax=Isoptericola jiangsuensis TaxID=548579 RepID=UPI00386B6A14
MPAFNRVLSRARPSTVVLLRLTTLMVVALAVDITRLEPEPVILLRVIVAVDPGRVPASSNSSMSIALPPLFSTTLSLIAKVLDLT